MGEVVDLLQDLCSPYHVSSSDNSSLNRVCSLVTQQERQFFGDHATIYGGGGGYGRGSYGR